MRIKKYVLLVDTHGGPLSGLAKELKRLEFSVALVPEKRAAIDFMRRFSKLGLIVINATEDAHQAELAAEAQQVHPNLPVVILGTRGCEVQTASKNWQIEGPVDAAMLQQQVADALREQSYPEQVLAALSFSTEEALAGFGSHFAAGQAYLRATRGMITDMTALLPFSGRRVSGYLAIGSSRETAVNLHKALFPTASSPEEEDLTDLLGEVCNRAIGRFHELFESRGLSFNFGVSLYLTGRSDLRAAQEHPALVLEFEGPAGSVLVELFLDGLIPNPTPSAAPDTPSPAGEFVLL